MNLLIAFIVGILVGLLLAFYALNQDAKISQSAPASHSASVDFADLMQKQIQALQAQNMLRQLQLEQARQEAELRTLSTEQQKYLALYHPRGVS